MAAVRWTVDARSDLRLLRAYFSRISPDFSRAFVARITQSTRNLGAFPRIGRTVPEFRDDTLREIIFQSYRIVYKIQSTGEVGVVAVVPASMDLRRRLTPRLWDLT